MLKKEKADHLHRMEKIIASNLHWKPLPGGRYRIDVTVFAPLDNEVLRLSCNIGKNGHGFCLLYQNDPVRKYTKHFLHRSRSTGEEFRQPHKHTWDEECGDDRVYIPSDIDPEANINEQLLAFLREENIQLQNGYQPILL